jgi:hypothetical protein
MGRDRAPCPIVGRTQMEFSRNAYLSGVRQPISCRQGCRRRHPHSTPRCAACRHDGRWRLCAAAGAEVSCHSISLQAILSARIEPNKGFDVNGTGTGSNFAATHKRTATRNRSLKVDATQRHDATERVFPSNAEALPAVAAPAMASTLTPARLDDPWAVVIAGLKDGAEPVSNPASASEAKVNEASQDATEELRQPASRSGRECTGRARRSAAADRGPRGKRRRDLCRAFQPEIRIDYLARLHRGQLLRAALDPADRAVARGVRAHWKQHRTRRRGLWTGRPHGGTSGERCANGAGRSDRISRRFGLIQWICRPVRPAGG